MANDGWFGFDLDGTLAHYDHWRGIDHVGEPIAPMVDLLKKHLAHGHDVRIFTARVCDENRGDVRGPIERWCEQHIGQVLPITNVKDFKMVRLYDDRCVQVETNTGRILGEL